MLIIHFYVSDQLDGNTNLEISNDCRIIHIISCCDNRFLHKQMFTGSSKDSPENERSMLRYEHL